MVYIKRVKTGDEEVSIASMLYHESLRSDSRNHCVPVLDVIQDDIDPNISYLVMPFLRIMNDPQFESVNEVIECVDQLLNVRDCARMVVMKLIYIQGLVFIHEQGVAHRQV